MKEYKFYYLIDNPFEVLLNFNCNKPLVTVSIFNIIEKRPVFKIIDNDIHIYIREFILKICFKHKSYTIESKRNNIKYYGNLKKISFNNYNKKINLINLREDYLNEIYSKQYNLKIKYEYKVNERYNKLFLEKLKGLGYSNINDGEDITKCINILRWISEKTIHNGNISLECNGKTMLEVMCCNEYDTITLNCRGKAKMASEILMMEGIKSRMVFCKQYEINAINDHVVVTAYIKEIDKWIMLDPTYNLLIKSDKDGFLSVSEFRTYLANQKVETLILSENMNYNGKKLNKMIYFREMRRSFYRFITTVGNYPGCDKNTNFIGLSPNINNIDNVVHIDNPEIFWS